MAPVDNHPSCGGHSGTELTDTLGSARRAALFSDRLLKPALLDASVYAEVLRDSSAGAPVARIVLLTSAAAALGHLGLGLSAVVAHLVAGLVVWLISVGLAYYLVTSELATFGVPGQRPSLGTAARVLAYANVPRGLLFLLALPLLGGGLFLAGWLAGAVLALTVIAYAQAIEALFDLDGRSSASIALVANTPAAISYLFVLTAI